MGEAGIRLALLETFQGLFIVGQWPAQQILAVGGFLGRGLVDMQAHPVANLAVGQRIFHHRKHLFVGDTGMLKPQGVEAFAKILLIVSV